VLTQRRRRAGDALVLTKPLGAGAVATALKRGLAARRAGRARGRGDDDAQRASAREQARAAGAHALTDVTGFGLLGHLHELALASGVAAEVDAAACPRSTACSSCCGDEPRDRRRHAPQPRATPRRSRLGRRRPRAARWLVCDAMTSGGLLGARRRGHRPPLRRAAPASGDGGARPGARPRRDARRGGRRRRA
jgi:selenide,water dikinase